MPVVPREGWVGSMEGLTLTNVHAVGRRAGMPCMVPRKDSQYFLAVKVSFRVALKEIKNRRHTKMVTESENLVCKTVSSGV